MSDEEISESEIVELLGTYANALEEQATIAPGSDRPDDTEVINTGGGALKKGVNMDSHAPDQGGPEAIELGAIPTPTVEPRRSRLLVGAACVAVAAVVGAVLVFNQDPSGVDTTEVAESVDEQQDVVVEEEEDMTSADDASDDATEGAVATDVVGDASFAGFGGPGTVVFTDDGEFVSIGGGPDGAVVSRSSNGTDWETQQVNGLPENSSPIGLTEVDGRWVTVVEVWPEFDEDQPEEQFFFDGPETERLIAVSDDLVNWMTSDFPDLDLEDNEFAWVIGIASSGDRVAMLTQVQTEGNDEMRILFDAGLLSGDDLENFCGLDPAEDGSYVALSCGFEEAMEDEEFFADDIEQDAAVPTTTIPPTDGDSFEQEELLRIAPGDPVFDEIDEIFNGRAFEDMPSLVISGPIDGPFEANEIPVGGYVGSLVGTDAGFVVAGSDFNTNSAVTASSVDGITWSEASEIGDSINVTTAAASGDRVAVVGQSINTGDVDVFISNDLGATWTNAAIPSELFSAWGEIAAGPAGFAVRLQGSTEPIGSPFGDIDAVSIESDGYTMTVSFGDGFQGTTTLTAPDGTVIHDSIPDQDLFEGDLENVARFEGQFDSTIVWLDPVTGEDLVRFEEEQMNDAFEEIAPEFEDADFDQNMAAETWFSVDGTTWTLLQPAEPADFNGGFSTVAAVGDDEVLIFGQQNVVPPDELFAFDEEGRPPTEAEEAALDEWFMNEGDSGGTWTAIPVG